MTAGQWLYAGFRNLVRAPAKPAVDVDKGVAVSHAPVGLFNTLTPEQRRAALAYDGPQDHGDEALKLR